MKYTDGSRHPRSLIIICVALIAAVPLFFNRTDHVDVGEYCE
jgi:hypothetical protein